VKLLIPIQFVLLAMTLQASAADRPSITEIQGQIDQLRTENAAQADDISELSVRVDGAVGPLGVLANGIRIGTTGTTQTFSDVESPLGYRFTVLTNGALSAVSTLRFADPGCSQPAFYSASTQQTPPANLARRVVNLVALFFQESEQSSISFGVHYLPDNATPQLGLTYQGFDDDFDDVIERCQLASPMQFNLWPVIPNDPAVTGVQNSYSPPIQGGY
jgi:hypothetical protein